MTAGSSTITAPSGQETPRSRSRAAAASSGRSRKEFLTTFRPSCAKSRTWWTRAGPRGRRTKLDRRRQKKEERMNQANKNEILSLFKDADALLQGHFKLTSGKHSEWYFEKIRLIENPAALDRIVAPL